MSIISFNYHDFIYTIKNIVYIYLISIFIGGTIYLINISFFPKENSFLLNFVILIIFSPIITYIYLKSNVKVKTNYSNYYKIDIYLKDRTKITLNSYLDTGNVLKDSYWHNPIILVNQSKIDISNVKTILVPYNTINSHGLLKCFKPSKIYIYNVGYRKRVMIGVIGEIGIEGADCILNKDLLERI